MGTYLLESLGFLSQQPVGDWATGMPTAAGGAALRGAGQSLGMAFLSGVCSETKVVSGIEGHVEEAMEVDTAVEGQRRRGGL